MKYIISLTIIFVVYLCTFFLKVLSYKLKNKEWNVLKGLTTGGMPSSHSAVVSSLATVIYLNEKSINNWFFIFAFIFAIIICYDAINVRWYTGLNSKKINYIVKHLDAKKLINKSENNILSVKSKEVLGHRKSEVLAGFLFGIVMTIVLFNYTTFLWKF